MSKVNKVIFSIVAIIAAALLIMWQVNNSGPKSYKVSDEVKAENDAYEASLKAPVMDALEKAAKGGWSSTASLWVSGGYNRSKKNLDFVFGKSFNVADVKIYFAGRDPEGGMPCVSFTYKDKNYNMFLQAPKTKTGKYLLMSFSAN